MTIPALSPYKAIDPTASAIHHGVGSGNPADLSGSVRICQTSNPSNVAVYDVPTPWVLNSATVGVYRNSTAAPGGPGAKVLKVKDDNSIKFVAKNLGDGDTAASDDSDIAKQILGGSGCKAIAKIPTPGPPAGSAERRPRRAPRGDKTHGRLTWTLATEGALE